MKQIGTIPDTWLWGVNKMVSVYLRDELLEEIMAFARQKNKALEKEGKKGDITTGRVVAWIVGDWYDARMEARA